MTGSDGPQPTNFDYNSFFGQGGGGGAHTFRFNFDDIFADAFGDDDDSFFQPHHHFHHPQQGKRLLSPDLHPFRATTVLSTNSCADVVLQHHIQVHIASDHQ